MFYTIYVENNKIRAGEKITFYANVEEGILLNEVQFHDLVEKTASEEFDDYSFNNWLNRNYTASDLYEETAHFFEELKQEYMEEPEITKEKNSQEMRIRAILEEFLAW